jgi:hypothetical protein
MEGNCVRKERNGRKLLRRLKPTVGCNDSKRRRDYNNTGHYDIPPSYLEVLWFESRPTDRVL